MSQIPYILAAIDVQCILRCLEFSDLTLVFHCFVFTFRLIVMTMPAWKESSVNSVITCSSSKPTNTSSVAENVNKTPGNCSMVNHPRLLTRIRTALLNLSFLKRCKTLKRPPQSLIQVKKFSIHSHENFHRGSISGRYKYFDLSNQRKAARQ